MVGTPAKAAAVSFLQTTYAVSERRACRVLQVVRSSHRSQRKRTDEVKLVGRIHALSQAYPRYGYRKIYWLLKKEEVVVGRERVRQIRRREGLAVKTQAKRRRCLGRSTATVRHAQSPHDVWSYDFVHDATATGATLKCLTVIDEFTRVALAVVVRRSFTSRDVVEVLKSLVAQHGRPAHLRSDNGPEFVAKRVQSWLHDHQIGTRYIDPGQPWQNGTNESFNAVLRDGCLNRWYFNSLRDAREQIEAFRIEYNTIRPHGSLNGETPDSFIKAWRQAPLPSAQAA